MTKPKCIITEPAAATESILESIEPTQKHLYKQWLIKSNNFISSSKRKHKINNNKYSITLTRLKRTWIVQQSITIDTNFVK